ncbi:MAG TPA: DUF72 domain-containing protein [Thermoplasmata archaeon]|nr:DUF72 domain-containing protein [Thermoplasmata archaeon]
MAAEVRVGASSWTSEAWWDRVYPKDVAPGDRLRIYSSLYDCVEVDSTYYSVPPRTMVKGWDAKTPEGFLFTLKFPREFLDPKKSIDAGKLDAFYVHAKLLGPKLGCVLMQFAPWVKPGKANEFIGGLLDQIDSDVPHALEMRDKGWFSGQNRVSLVKELRDREITFAWSYLTYVDVPDEVTSDTIYLRFIGDHDTIPAETHGELRADKSAETASWILKIEKHRDEVKRILVFFNNHYAGFAPASINLFRKMLGMVEIDYSKALERGSRVAGLVGKKGRIAAKRGVVTANPKSARLDDFG